MTKPTALPHGALTRDAPTRALALGLLVGVAGAGACLAEYEIEADGLLCPATQLYCDGDCVSIAIDEEHCGACGRVCPDDFVCVEGDCVGDGDGDGDGDGEEGEEGEDADLGLETEDTTCDASLEPSCNLAREELSCDPETDDACAGDPVG